ncbi:MAG: DUF4286 family protein [Flavobacteriales bacterium]
MILYNVTVNIDKDVHEEWLQWMKEKHIPDVMSTGIFIENKMNRILTGEQEGGVSYAIQYLCESEEKLKEYEEKYAPALQEEHTKKFQGKFGAFRTIMEVVHREEYNSSDK